jgi:DNA-binding ferritin-like protein
MSEQNEDRSERARTLTEDAVAEYAKGDKARGDKLAEQAVKTDRATVEQVVRDLEEDARSTHDASGGP